MESQVTYVFEGINQFQYRPTMIFRPKWIYDIFDIKTMIFKTLKFWRKQLQIFNVVYLKLNMSMDGCSHKSTCRISLGTTCFEPYSETIRAMEQVIGIKAAMDIKVQHGQWLKSYTFIFLIAKSASSITHSLPHVNPSLAARWSLLASQFLFWVTIKEKLQRWHSCTRPISNLLHSYIT